MADTVETRYFQKTADTHTINGLLAIKLITATPNATALQKVVTAWVNAAPTSYHNFDIILRHSDTSEDVLGSAVAQTTRATPGAGLQSATWSCPQTSIASTDAVKVVMRAGMSTGETATGVFITEQVSSWAGADKSALMAATWTISRYAALSDDGEGWRQAYTGYGTTDANYRSYISGFTYGVVSTPVNITVPSAAFNFTPKVPTVHVSDNKNISIPTRNFNFTGQVLTVGFLAPVQITIPTRSFNFTRFAPTVRIGQDKQIAIPTAVFNLTGQVPIVSRTLNVAITIPTRSFPFTGQVPGVSMTNTAEEVSWGLYDTEGDSITGAASLTAISVRRRDSGYLLDWSDNAFKVGGGSTPSMPLIEADAVNWPGDYYRAIVIGSWPDGWYIARTTYIPADYPTTPKQNGAVEFLIRGGQMVDSYNSSNIDMRMSTVNDTVLTRASQSSVNDIPTDPLLAANYTAPDNEGIASNGVAIAAVQADVTSILEIVALLNKYARNKKVIWKDPGTGIKYLIIYDDDGTTELVRKSLKDPTAANIADLTVGSLAQENASSV